MAGVRRGEEGGDGNEVGDGNEEGGVVGMARRLWMGGEKEGWEKRRMEEEREGLERGVGYSGLIAERIREVFGRGG